MQPLEQAAGRCWQSRAQDERCGAVRQVAARLQQPALPLDARHQPARNSNVAAAKLNVCLLLR